MGGYGAGIVGIPGGYIFLFALFMADLAKLMDFALNEGQLSKLLSCNFFVQLEVTDPVSELPDTVWVMVRQIWISDTAALVMASAEVTEEPE